MRELTELKQRGTLVDALLADHGLFHLEADLRWIELTCSAPRRPGRGGGLVTRVEGTVVGAGRTIGEGGGLVLSFGQTPLARGLVTRPDVLFADEPAGSLDSLSGELVMGLLTSAAREQGSTVVPVIHEPEVAAYADREVIVRDGLVTSPQPVRRPRASRRPGISASGWLWWRSGSTSSAPGRSTGSTSPPPGPAHRSCRDWSACRDRGSTTPRRRSPTCSGRSRRPSWPTGTRGT